MSTHNICFRGKIRKILCGYPLLSVAMFRGLQTVFGLIQYIIESYILQISLRLLST